ncbi:matrixin family metalloprotease [Pontibacter sp. 172403-2]|uniref:matrixin family metalloprotease n=1 Tax=Pontibacter rufus TaxID=2791028 RepID=UPI0018AF6D8F|nr:matrixin family metalloprotease [Pontibacter sp. 172403-2]MBF9254743.1 matrixin family metalloprotease [Pontibacter sp. 172403-2]
MAHLKRLAIQILANRGYLNVTDDIFLRNRDVDEIANDLIENYKYLQNKTEMSNDEVIEQIVFRPKCGNSTFVRNQRHLIHNENILRFAKSSGYKFNLSSLGNPPVISYSIKNYYPQIHKDDIEQAVRYAFDEWEQFIPISFRRTNPNENSIIKLSWEQRNHNCVLKFDGRRTGRGNSVAHAGYPDIHSSIFGQIHFDYDEIWSVNPRNDMEIDLQSVTLHEVGHILGLEHSLIEGEVMYEDYIGINRRLTMDDIQSIKDLYNLRSRIFFT